MEVLICKKSRRGRDKGPTVQPSGTMASPLQGPARWAVIAAGMHAANAAGIDDRTERAEAQKQARREARAQKRGVA